MLIQLKDGGNVATPVAIVWCGPNSDQCITKHRLVAFHHKLMGASDEIELVGGVELKTRKKRAQETPNMHAIMYRTWLFDLRVSL